MLPPSEARTPRPVTSAMSGAVTRTTSAPARPETASRATSVTTASPSAPGGSTGSARCTSNRSWAIDQTAWWVCTSATAIRAAVRLAASSSTAGARSGVHGGKLRDLLVHRRQRAQFTVHGLGLPGGEPLRRGGLRCTGPPGERAARLGFGAAGVLPGLLVQQPERAPGRRLAVQRLVLAGEPSEFAGDGDGAGAEQVHDVLGNAADLGAVAVGPGHHFVAQRRQSGLQDPVGDRGHAEPLAVQGAGVQGAPLVVGAVGALDPVPDRDVHMQLRVTVAGQVVQEQAGDQAAAVPPLPRLRRMVPGPGVGGMPVEPGSLLRAPIPSARPPARRRWASNAAAWASSPRSRACRAQTR